VEAGSLRAPWFRPLPASFFLLFRIGDGLPEELQLLPQIPALRGQPRRLVFDEFDEADPVHAPILASRFSSIPCVRSSENTYKAKFVESPFREP
jgi:hypothetical protein